MDKEQVAKILVNIATLLDLKGENPFKSRAYVNAARALEGMSEPLETLITEERLAGIRGIGDSIAKKVAELVTTGKLTYYEELKAATPPGLVAMLEALRSHPDVIRCSTAGSLRRHREIIGDIDLLASSKQPAGVLDYFTQQPGILNVIAKGDTKASVLLKGGIQSDLRVVSDAEFPFALMYFTGSKEHNIVMRQRAIERGLRLNEYGLFRSTVETRDPKLLVPGKTEEEIFEKVGLHYIEPEMREDMGEIALAEKGPLPRLIEWTDLKGSLHNHSTWSDGHQRPEEIVQSMRQLGLAYWAITDHSKASFQANGLDAE